MKIRRDLVFQRQERLIQRIERTKRNFSKRGQTNLMHGTIGREFFSRSSSFHRAQRCFVVSEYVKSSPPITGAGRLILSFPITIPGRSSALRKLELAIYRGKNVLIVMKFYQMSLHGKLVFGTLVDLHAKEFDTSSSPDVSRKLEGAYAY